MAVEGLAVGEADAEQTLQAHGDLEGIQRQLFSGRKNDSLFQILQIIGGTTEKGSLSYLL